MSTVDVRDMLCVQALALIARAVKRLHVGQAADVLYNTEDVRRDVMAWASERGHEVLEATDAALRITRRH